MTWAVQFENVGKTYRRSLQGYPTLVGSLSKAAGRLARRQQDEQEKSWALRDLSFEINQGESVGLIGHNGAGKTSALRILSHINQPTTGVVRHRGRVGALIEVGSGVSPELTGRENIWLYGSMVGIPRKEIARRFDDIVDFSELGRSVDLQVKYLSSGMQLRLGFAVASHLEPEIFAVDEALAVGDASFQAKCVKRMSSLVRDGSTILFVSHQLAAVESLCERTLLLENGQLIDDGASSDVIERYAAMVTPQAVDLAASQRDDMVVQITHASFRDRAGSEIVSIGRGEEITLHLEMTSKHPLTGPNVIVNFTDGRPGALLECSMVQDGNAPEATTTKWSCDLRIEGLPLAARTYEANVLIVDRDGYSPLMDWCGVGSIEVGGVRGEGKQAATARAFGAPVAVDYEWVVNDLP